MTSKKFSSRIIVLMSILACMVCEQYVIREITLSSIELKERISKFNIWIKEIAENAVAEAELTEIEEIVFKASSDLTSENSLLQIESDYIVDTESIYGSISSLREFVAELDKKYTLDDSVYFILYLISEYFNKSSKIRAFLDLLPTQLPSPAFNYNDTKLELNNELARTVLLKKIVDYHLAAKSLANMIFNNVITEHSNILNPDLYNILNLEWAIYIYDFYTARINER